MENQNNNKTEVYIKSKGIIIRSEIIEVDNKQPENVPLNTTLPLFNIPAEKSISTKPFLPPALPPAPKHNPTYRQRIGKQHYFNNLSEADQKATIELVVEYFKDKPELLENGSGYNHERILHQRILAEQLDLVPNDIRTCLRKAGLVDQRPPQVIDGSQYTYIYEHLDELLEKYRTIKHRYLYDQPRLMGIPHYYMDIMFYLSGMFSNVSKTNYNTIAKRVRELNLPIRRNVS